MDCNINSHKFGVAVSGGADSVSLLLSLCSILSSNPNPIKVITVNHNIREEQETAGDARFVFDLCECLKEKGCKVECKIVTIPKGFVQKICDVRKAGVEEAARYLRYKAFEDFVKENKLDYLCLAHNQNDQLETILMRFLKGSSLEALCGISEKRAEYIRPLISIERSEIEEYLVGHGVSWRNDSTNFETEYDRNKIRLQLIPVLNQLFPDWKKSVLSGNKKYALDSILIKNIVDSFELEMLGEAVVFNADSFIELPEAVQYRILIKACNLAGEDSRIPFNFVMDFIAALNADKDSVFTKTYGNIEIETKKRKVLVKKHINSNTELSFFDIIEDNGKYSYPFGNLEVKKAGNDSVEFLFNGCPVLLKSELPLIIRNVCMDDSVGTADGSDKKVADVLSDWHVETEKKRLIPVIQELTDAEQKIICIAGAFLGYKDWIIKL